MNLQLLTCYSLFRNLPCSTTDLLTIEADKISVTLEIAGVSRTIILNVFWQIEHNTGLLHKIKLYIVYGKIFFLINSFLSSASTSTSASTTHILSVALTLECVRILFWSIFFFYFNCLPGHVLCKIAIWTDDTVATSWDSLWVIIWSWKYENAILEISEIAILHPIIFWYLENYSIFTS